MTARTMPRSPGHSVRRTRGWLLAACAVTALTACRDGVAHLTLPPETGTSPAVRQVTFGDGNDRDPRWSHDGSVLLYHTDRFGMMPQAQGVMLELDPVRVRAQPLFGELQQRAVQNGSAYMMATPAPAPDGRRAAYMDMQIIDSPAVCIVPQSTPFPATPEICNMQPLLAAAVLRVRDHDAIGPQTQDPSIPLELPGTDPKYRLTEFGPYDEQIFPFQERHRTEHALLFRPSWSPDGEQLVVSNGLRLLRWTVGSASFDTIPNTYDGVSPAWSPDGQWIAYTELVRGDSVTVTCRCVPFIGARIDYQDHRRTMYVVTERRLVLVRTDGSERVVIGVGEDAAWTADGQYIYAVRDGAVVRVTRTGSDATVIPHTHGARSPSVSPDGRWLAFSRAKEEGMGDYDIWVVSLEQ